MIDIILLVDMSKFILCLFGYFVIFLVILIKLFVVFFMVDNIIMSLL